MNAAMDWKKFTAMSTTYGMFQTLSLRDTQVTYGFISTMGLL